MCCVKYSLPYFRLYTHPRRRVGSFPAEIWCRYLSTLCNYEAALLAVSSVVTNEAMRKPIEIRLMARLIGRVPLVKGTGSDEEEQHRIRSLWSLRGTVSWVLLPSLPGQSDARAGIAMRHPLKPFLVLQAS